MRSTMCIMSAQVIFVRADTSLQAEMAAAVIALVASVEAEGGGNNGIYRLKLEGETITMSMEKFHRSRQFHRLPTPVLE